MEKSLQTSDECLILLAVKDRDLIGANQLMGESFLDFRRIARGSADESIDMADLDQIILPLTKPTDQGIFHRFELESIQFHVNLDVHFVENCKNDKFISESEYLNVLEGRTWDKAAKDFVKRERKHAVKNKWTTKKTKWDYKNDNDYVMPRQVLIEKFLYIHIQLLMFNQTTVYSLQIYKMKD